MEEVQVINMLQLRSMGWFKGISNLDTNMF
jgi:hypothetical protein